MNDQEQWLMQSLSIYKSYVKDQPYEGNVTFQNGVKMQFSLKLDAQKCSKIISILKDEITDSARDLGDMMMKSMPVALPQSTDTEIKEG